MLDKKYIEKFAVMVYNQDELKRFEKYVINKNIFYSYKPGGDYNLPAWFEMTVEKVLGKDMIKIDGHQGIVDESSKLDTVEKLIQYANLEVIPVEAFLNPEEHPEYFI